MGLSHSPKIVTNGLIRYMDATNLKSYAGSGTAWYDLVSRPDYGTLTNGVAYSNGIMTFDGTDDHVFFSNQASMALNDFSLGVWFNHTFNTLGFDTLFSRETARFYFGYGDDGQYRFFVRGDVYATNGTQFEGGVGAAGLVKANTWQYAHMNIEWSTSTFTIYHNGALAATKTDSTLGTTFINVASNDAVIGSRYAGNTANKFQGLMTVFSYYNRILTQTEILQNFNALRGRYGI